MSTNMTHYVMYGTNFPPKVLFPDGAAYEKYAAIDDNAYDEKFDPDKIAMVYDGMCGKYVIVGYILAKGDEVSGMPMTEIQHYHEMGVDFLVDLKHNYPEIAELPHVGSKTALWAFTHWH